jgi:hypothetical protein
MTAAAKATHAPRFHAVDFSKLDITIISPLLLHCGKCGAYWEPSISIAGRLFGRWWVCPHGCLDKPDEDAK